MSNQLTRDVERAISEAVGKLANHEPTSQDYVKAAAAAAIAVMMGEKK